MERGKDIRNPLSTPFLFSSWVKKEKLKDAKRKRDIRIPFQLLSL
jgi:hypothetical protein